jgi:hypothetical protein
MTRKLPLQIFPCIQFGQQGRRTCSTLSEPLWLRGTRCSCSCAIARKAWVVAVKHVVSALVVCSFPLVAPSSALATPLGFACISNNSVAGCAVLQAQLHMDVTLNPTSSMMVDFLFTNVGSAASSITEVYFDDVVPALLGSPGKIEESSGVKFATGCTPHNLPAGHPVGFSSNYCVGSEAPTQPSGVNPGEWLRVSYTLQPSATLAQVLAALDGGDYRVGIHVQGFQNGQSESGISGPVPTPSPVPEPASLVMVGTGLMLVARAARKDRRRATTDTSSGGRPKSALEATLDPRPQDWLRFR